MKSVFNLCLFAWLVGVPIALGGEVTPSAAMPDVDRRLSWALQTNALPETCTIVSNFVLTLPKTERHGVPQWEMPIYSLATDTNKLYWYFNADVQKDGSKWAVINLSTNDLKTLWQTLKPAERTKLIFGRGGYRDIGLKRMPGPKVVTATK